MEKYAITEQPKGVNDPLMEKADELPIPDGLQPLYNMDYIRVRQKIIKCEICSGCEKANKYKLYNAQGQAMFKADETSCCCWRRCCGHNRPFEITIQDTNNRDLIKFNRPCQCHCSCCPCCCLQRVEVYYANGHRAGTVEQLFTCCRPEFRITDSATKQTLLLQGPRTSCTCALFCRTTGFEIKQDGEKIGILRKEFSGAGKETITDADNFYVTFPPELNINLKTALIGAVFLIDFMYFES